MGILKIVKEKKKGISSFCIKNDKNLEITIFCTENDQNFGESPCFPYPCEKW